MVNAWDGLAKLSVPWPVFSPRLLAEARRLVKWSEVVLAHGFAYLPSLAAIRQVRRFHTKVAIYQHNPRIEFGSPLLDATQRLAEVTIGRWAFRRANIILVPSAASNSYVRTVWGRDSRTLPPGIDVEEFRPHESEEARQQERSELGVPADSFFVLGAGRLTSKNRFDILLRAVADCRHRIPVYCLLTGGGPQYQKLTGMVADLAVADCVRLDGYVSDEDLRRRLRSADVTVVPAGSSEGFGLVIAESLASGVPVIAGSQGGHLDLVSEGDNGWLFDGSARGLAQTLEKANAQLLETGRARWAQQARLTVEGLTWVRHVMELEKVLVEAAKR